MKDNRKFIRHEVKVPLEVSALTSLPGIAHEVVNVSYGGLAFLVETQMYEGQEVALRMPTVKPLFEAVARVQWCRPDGVKYQVGVAFLNSNDAAQSQMIEQILAIEAYRLQEMKKGRRLTTPEASAEWLRKHPDHV